MRYADPQRPAGGAVVMVGVALIVTSPAYPWYTALVVALAALAGRPEWLPLAVAAYLPIFGKDAGISYTRGIAIGYLTAAAVAAIVTLARVRLSRRAAAVPRPATVALALPAPPRAASAAAPQPGLAPASAGSPGAPVADVVLPCLDEAAALPYVLSRLPPGYRAIVVDNGSSDGSAEIASRLAPRGRAGAAACPGPAGPPVRFPPRDGAERGGRRVADQRDRRALPASYRAVEGDGNPGRDPARGARHAARLAGGHRMTTLIVIAKAPVPGRVKTRLSPPFTPAQSAALAEAALADTLETVLSAASAQPILALDGAPGGWLPSGFAVIPQVQGGLDTRIAPAFPAAARPPPRPPLLTP